MSIKSTYRFTPKEQYVINKITPTNSKHVSKLISAGHCTGESETQESLSIRMRNSCTIEEEIKAQQHNTRFLLVNASTLLNLE